jgi:proteasome assembly chaperone 2
MIKWLQKTQESVTFEDHTLIIPAVSVGNVGQLTIDLVLENARYDDNPRKVAQIFHSGLEPVVANNVTVTSETDNEIEPGKRKSKKPIDQGRSNPVAASVDEKDCLMTACEVYRCPKKQWIVLQFHSAIRKRDREKFLSFLLDWIREVRFKTIVCFSSIFTSEKLDASITGVSSRIQVLYTDKIDSSYLDKIKSLGWKRLLSPTVLSKIPKVQDIDPLEFIEENLNSVNLSGGGITKSMLQACQTSGIPCLTLLVYASDGENTVDALFLYKEASQLFQFLPQPRGGDPPSKIKIPYIWHQHLGVNPNMSLDGPNYDAPPNVIF